jgi:hypothetical protein
LDKGEVVWVSTEASEDGDHDFSPDENVFVSKIGGAEGHDSCDRFVEAGIMALIKDVQDARCTGWFCWFGSIDIRHGDALFS